jgi:hypothetical protein
VRSRCCSKTQSSNPRFLLQQTACYYVIAADSIMRLRTSSRLSRMILCPATTAITAATLYMCTAMAVASTCASTPLLCGDLSPPPAFDATFVTTAGNFTVTGSRLCRLQVLSSRIIRTCVALPAPAQREQVHSELAWAPLGSARFYTLCRLGYYSQVKCVWPLRSQRRCNGLQVRARQSGRVLPLCAPLRGAVVRRGFGRGAICFLRILRQFKFFECDRSLLNCIFTWKRRS